MGWRTRIIQPFLSTQTGSWISGKAFSDYLTAKGHAHEYLNVYENQIADVHPPLYYLFMHAVCSAFQNPPFTKWTGIGLNLFFFSLTQFGLLLLSARLLSDGEKPGTYAPGASAGAAVWPERGSGFRRRIHPHVCDDDDVGGLAGACAGLSCLSMARRSGACARWPPC